MFLHGSVEVGFCFAGAGVLSPSIQLFEFGDVPEGAEKKYELRNLDATPENPEP